MRFFISLPGLLELLRFFAEDGQVEPGLGLIRIDAQGLSDVSVEHLARVEPDVVVGVDHELQVLVMVQPVREALRIREEAVVPRVSTVALAVFRHRAVLLNVPAHIQDQRMQRQLASLVLRQDCLRRRLVNPRLPVCASSSFVESLGGAGKERRHLHFEYQTP